MEPLFSKVQGRTRLRSQIVKFDPHAVYPHLDTLRAITQEWPQDHLGPDLAAHCGPRYLKMFPEAPALIHLDGHFVPYSGHEAYAGRGYPTLKHLVVPGHEQFWVHDGQGHPLWVEEAAGNASFYQAIQDISDRVHAWRTGRLLVVYDRGGVSEDTAAYLVSHDMDFLCYGKTRAVPKTVVWSEITLWRAGKERTYAVWEHTRKWGTFDGVREIWVKDGPHTFPVLTSHTHGAIGELLIALWGRWKQENNFKLLVHDYGVNHFGDRDTTVLENRPMVNPERTRSIAISAAYAGGFRHHQKRRPRIKRWQPRLRNQPILGGRSYKRNSPTSWPLMRLLRKPCRCGSWSRKTAGAPSRFTTKPFKMPVGLSRSMENIGCGNG